jgi:hypothetical protein
MTPMEVILNGLRQALADDEQMDYWEERRKEKKREEEKEITRIDGPFPFVKCESCGKPYRLISNLCPWCRECNHKVATITLSNGEKQCGCCLKMIKE